MTCLGGLIFDQSLRFHRHLKDLKIRSANALNILKVLANTHWGADRTSLLRLYRALIRSKLDYGSVVYSSACKSLLKILDPVHHQALRLCLGAFRTSPVESLYAEAYEPPLDLRRKTCRTITGNELADTAARSATGSSERFPIPHSDLKACFRLKLQSVWQSNWDQQTENKLHSIMPILAPTAPSLSNRREQISSSSKTLDKDCGTATPHVPRNRADYDLLKMDRQSSRKRRFRDLGPYQRK
ncbi:uncharacterized protein TNCV_3816861 [Trichonephila clavipes]|nr:uncharacterized protein TNCV_3816861 [Trichonephila clavipes]